MRRGQGGAWQCSNACPGTMLEASSELRGCPNGDARRSLALQERSGCGRVTWLPSGRDGQQARRRALALLRDHVWSPAAGGRLRRAVAQLHVCDDCVQCGLVSLAATEGRDLRMPDIAARRCRAIAPSGRLGAASAQPFDVVLVPCSDADAALYAERLRPAGAPHRPGCRERRASKKGGAGCSPAWHGCHPTLRPPGHAPCRAAGAAVSSNKARSAALARSDSMQPPAVTLAARLGSGQACSPPRSFPPRRRADHRDPECGGARRKLGRRARIKRRARAAAAAASLAARCSQLSCNARRAAA
jgi:hypothetical protein